MSKRPKTGSNLPPQKDGGQLTEPSKITSQPIALSEKKDQRGPKGFLDPKQARERAVPPGSKGDGGQPPAGSDRPRVCILDSDPQSLNVLRELLSAMDYTVLALPQIIGASSQIQRFAPDLLVLDIALPSLSIPMLVEVLRRNLSPMPPLILFSYLAEEELARLALEVQANDFTPKSRGYVALVNRIKALSRR